MKVNDPFELFSVDLSNEEFARAFFTMAEDMSEKFGFLCFSKDASNPVLWSHYGERHQGMCLVF